MKDLATTDTALRETENLISTLYEAEEEVFSDQSWSEFVRDLSLRYFGKDTLLVANPTVAKG